MTELLTVSSTDCPLLQKCPHCACTLSKRIKSIHVHRLNLITTCVLVFALGYKRLGAGFFVDTVLITIKRNSATWLWHNVCFHGDINSIGNNLCTKTLRLSTRRHHGWVATAEQQQTKTAEMLWVRHENTRVIYTTVRTWYRNQGHLLAPYALS